MPPLDRADRMHSSYVLLVGIVSLLSAGLLVYSQTMAFAWDEGFHLLAAQLIKAGQRPYLDFCFPQTPLNAYWNAFGMRIFGESWRTAHAVAALLAGGSAMLAADYVFTRFPVARWRMAAAIATALGVGLNVAVIQFGTIGQAYGICLFLIATAFRLAILAVGKDSLLLAASTGLLAGAAAMCSLLTAPVAPVLLVWMLFNNRAGKRWTKFTAFLGGAAIAFLPLIWLFSNGPRQVIFNVIQYHLLYRRLRWAGASGQNIDALMAWIDSSQALLLGSLAIAGLIFIKTSSGWNPWSRAELYLCGWLAVALTAHISIAQPTFPRYYLLTVPFLGILAAVGLYAVGTRLGHPDRPGWALLIVALVFVLAAAKAVYDGRDDFRWSDFERIARTVDQATPRDGLVSADEQVYFLTRRPPPPGAEQHDSHKFKFSPALSALLHIVPQADLDQQIKSGRFDTVQTCDDDKIEELGLPQLYSQKSKVEDCTVFWGRAPVRADLLRFR